MSIFRYVLLALSLLLTACQQPVPHYSAQQWEAQRPQVEALTQWNLTGKLAIVTAKKKGSLRLFWQQNGDDYRLNLSTVLGTRVLELSRQGNRILLTDEDGKEHVSNDPALLIYRLTGWLLPIDELPTWIKGLPGAAQYGLSQDGQLAWVQDEQWQLTYQEFASQATGRGELRLPTRLDLKGPDTRLKLMINQWNLQP